MICPECGKRLEIAVCVGPHPRYRHVVSTTKEQDERFARLQEEERIFRYRRAERPNGNR